MKLTEEQKELLKEHDWDAISNNVDGEEQNCSWVSISPEDGAVFQEIADSLGLTGDNGDIKLLVVGTKEEE
jgi:hypothetical protein